MSKIKVEVEIEVPDDAPKFERYSLVRASLSQASNQIAEENSKGNISFANTSGSWKLEEVEDE